jgi:hypothetical protein
MPDEPLLRQKAREAILSNRLPREKPTAMYGGTSQGGRCDMCAGSIDRGDVEIELCHAYAGLWSAWKRACRAAKVDNLNLHDFRRGAYDECAAAGLDVHAAMELIGHRNIATAARYMKGGNVARQRRSLARLEEHRATVNGAPASREPGINGGKTGARPSSAGFTVRLIK